MSSKELDNKKLLVGYMDGSIFGGVLSLTACLILFFNLMFRLWVIT